MAGTSGTAKRRRVQPSATVQGPSPPRQRKKLVLSYRMKDRFRFTEKPADPAKLSSDPVKLFDLFFDDEVIETVVHFTHQYARSKGNESFNTSPNEIRAFIGILLVSGYSPAPRRYLYWNRDTDVYNEAIASTMTRNRFDELAKYLHVSNNATLDAGDKLSKVRPLLSMLNERFLAFF